MNQNLYTEDSIQKLDPLSFTRLRPDTYLGSNEDSTQLAREIISNCSDEFLAGNCDIVTISYDDKKNIITIEDNGQGILPNVKKENNKTILELVYGDINTSGKYDRSKDAVYKVSTGAFGIGASLTNFLSHWLTATTKRDGQYETVHFIEGKFHSRKTGTCDISDHGVKVSFNPSEEFFRNSRPNIDKMKLELFNLSCVCAGLRFIFNGEEIFHPKGIVDILKDKTQNTVEVINNIFSFQESNTSQSLDFCLTVTAKSSAADIIPFCNCGLIEAGTPITTIKSTITRTLNKWGKEQKLIKENLSGTALQEGMCIVFNLTSPDIRYDSQTKVRVTSTEDNSFISLALADKLEIWLDNNVSDGKTIIEKALISKKAAEAAKKAREKVRNSQSNKKSKKKKFIELPTTLIDATSKDREKCELIIVEGLSAASSLVAQRDASRTAVYSIRGMMLNVQKTLDEKIVQNKEINNLILALGLDYNPKNGKMKYDKNKLRYGKIIAASDADPAGCAIENLLFNIIWQLCPELILNGHVYSAEPPLFKVTTKKNTYVFLSDQQALNEYQEKHQNEIKEIHRCKGLAEELPEELAEFVLEKDTRKLKQLVVKDFDKTDKLFLDLYGKDVPPRVEYINNNEWEVKVDYE